MAAPASTLSAATRNKSSKAAAGALTGVLAVRVLQRWRPAAAGARRAGAGKIAPSTSDTRRKRSNRASRRNDNRELKAGRAMAVAVRALLAYRRLPQATAVAAAAAAVSNSNATSTK